MQIGFNANIKVLMGGSFCGGTNWNKESNDIDNCFKLYYLRKGSADILGNNQTFTLNGPGLYFINGYSIRNQICLEKMVVDWLHFHPESVYFNHILRYSSCVLKLDLDEFSSFQHLFKKYNVFFKGSNSKAEMRIINLQIQSFIQYAISSVFAKIDQSMFDDSGSFLRLLPALEFINLNYTKNLNLNQIAEECFLSPNYFHRLFTDVFKTSPLNYIRQIRLEEAIRQLTYTAKAVKEVAYAVGYEDEAYFSRTFSKVYGISPGKFRKNTDKRLP